MNDQDKALVVADPYANELIESLLSQLTEGSRESYSQAIGEFLYFAWNRSNEHPYQNPHSCFAAYKGWLQEAAYKSNTANKKLSAVRKFYEYAAAANKITHPQYLAIKNVKNFRGDGDPFRTWMNEEEARRLFNAPDTSTVKGLRDKVAFLFMLVMGMRRKEAVTVRWSQIKQIDGIWVVADVLGKGQKYRTLIMPDKYVPLLEQYADGHKEGYVLVKIAKNGNKGDSLTERAINDIVEEYAKMLGLEDITPHSLRRTNGTIALDHGVSMDDIQANYGHEDQRTTRKYLQSKLNLNNMTTQVMDF